MEDKQQTEVVERDATLDPEPVHQMTDDELQDSILEDSGMNRFQKFVAKLDEAQWTLAQRIVGALLGLIAGVALFMDTGNSEGAFSYSLIIAVLVAMAGPNIIEKQSLRRIPKLRTTMVIVLALVLVAYFVMMGVQSGFNFTN